jgi:hypothetical protein
MSVYVEIPAGKSVSGCAGCGEVFTCLSAFDHHQSLTPEGNVCLSPDSRGLILYERESKGEIWGLWGWPASEGESHWTD